jgi:ElaB/YqjD/DUF883 family membrane-anchored ribosome-binding protein
LRAARARVDARFAGRTISMNRRTNAMSAQTMNAANHIDQDIPALRDDIAALQRDVGILLGHLKSSATNGAQSAADQVQESTTRAYRHIAAESARSVAAMERQVEDRPLMAVLIAAGVGYIGGRLLSR